MDTEQLKLILELISGTTGDAKQVAVAWLIIQGLGPVVTVVGYALSAWVLTKLGSRALTLMLSTNGDTIEQLASIVQTRKEHSDGMCQPGGSMQVISNREIVRRVSKAFKKNET